MKSTIAVALGLVIAQLTAPSVSDAQQTGKPARIGLMRSDPPPAAYLSEFRTALRELGHIEGKTYVLVPKWVKGRKKREAAAKYLARNVDLILTESTSISKAAASAGAKVQPPIPVVFVSSGAPVRSGLVKSLAAPGGNITGIYSGSLELMSKRMEILKLIVPRARRIASMHRLGSRMQELFDAEVKRAAPALGVEAVTYPGRSLGDLITAIQRSHKDRIDGWNIRGTTRYTRKQRLHLINTLNKIGVPAVFGARQLVTLGGLVSYGTNRAAQYRQAASYVDKILKGANPANLPVERPAKFNLVINLKTAKALGIAIPPSILLRADEVIE